MYKPFIFQLPVTKTELVNESKIQYSLSDINAQPIMRYGFHSWIHQTKDKLVKLNSDALKGKTMYNVVELFNDVVPNYDQSISTVTKKYLGVDVNMRKLELWEILTIFGLSGNLYMNDVDYDDMIKAFYKKSDLKYKLMEDPLKLDTYININEVSGDVKFYEQEQYKNLIEAIYETAEGLNKGGSTVIRIYDTYTDISIKLMKLLSEMFEEVYVYKPYMMYARDATKYLVGIKYKGNYKYAKELKALHANIKTEKLNNIYLDYNISSDFEFVVKFMNIELGNYEHKMINILIDYINKSNFFGDTYHSAIENQKKTSEFWIQNFYPSTTKEYKKSKDTLMTIMEKVIKDNNENMKNMFKNLNV
jgi:23S rRNA U2552 (ribose-2'-O)-methylase RlmE/FtsJ